MAYYDFDRHYKVKADSFKEAQVKFSRALENNEEDQYYVQTTYGFSQNNQTANTKPPGLAVRILMILVTFFGWFLKGAIEQFTYTDPKKPKRYRRY
jgi:hypothetical protein